MFVVGSWKKGASLVLCMWVGLGYVTRAARQTQNHKKGVQHERLQSRRWDISSENSAYIVLVSNANTSLQAIGFRSSFRSDYDAFIRMTIGRLTEKVKSLLQTPSQAKPFTKTYYLKVQKEIRDVTQQNDKE